MSKPALLAVDDDPPVLAAVTRDLRSKYGQEFRVVGARGGAEGVEAAEELKRRGDEVALVLADQRMPVVTGIELLEAIQLLYPEAKRVLLTAYADTQVAIDGINRVGLDHYLMKPWDPPEEHLYPVLDELLDDWRAGRVAPFEGIRVVGPRWSALTHDVKDFLALNRIPYRFLDIERDPEAPALLAALDDASVPVVVFPDGSALGRPDRRLLAERVGLRVTAGSPYYDLLIVGAGPAGLAAALYGATEGLSVAIVERRAAGGQAGTSSRIDNYLGFPAGISGADLARRAKDQAGRWGAELLTAVEVTSVRMEEPMCILGLSDGAELRGRSLIIASGMTVRTLEVPGYERLRGTGVYYGATAGEGAAYQGEEVVVVGGANSAGQAALMFSRHAKTVVLVVRAPTLGSRMSSYLVDQVEATPNIEVAVGTQVLEVLGDDHLEEVVLQTGDATRVIAAAGLFVFVGAIPHTDFLDGVVALNAQGFVLTGPDLPAAGWPIERDPYLLETSVPGVFAAGDVRHGAVRRVAAAVGMGSTCVTFVHQYLETV